MPKVDEVPISYLGSSAPCSGSDGRVDLMSVPLAFCN